MNDSEFVPDEELLSGETRNNESHDDASYVLVSNSDLELIDYWTREIFQCAWCYRNYREIENLGPWFCFQHVGRLVDAQWSCCREDVRSKGCVRAHHKSTSGAYTIRDEEFRLDEALCARIAARLDPQTRRQRRVHNYHDTTSVINNAVYSVIQRFDVVGEHHVLTERRRATSTELKQLDTLAHELLAYAEVS